MGEWIIDFYKNKIKREHKIAFFVTFILALVIHLYMFTNNIPSEETVYNYYHTQNMTTSGRWALSFFCSFSSYFNLPWICGLISATFISFTVVVLTEIFKIKKPLVVGLMAGLLVTSTAVTDTFQYIYTADGYMIAMLLATLAVYLTRIDEKRTIRYILSCILLCLACGIYQTFIPFALVLVLFEAIEILIENNHKKKECLQWLGKQLILYVAAVALYYVIWRVCLYFCHIQAHDYLGISQVGTLTLDMILQGLEQIPLIIKRFFFATPSSIYFAPFSILNMIFILASIMVLIYVFFKKKIYKNVWKLILFILCLLLIAPCSCFWVFTTTELGAWNYYPRMLGSLALIFIFILVLYEKHCGNLQKNALFILVLAIIFNNTVMINILYTRMEKTYERSYADGLEMTIRIHDVVDNFKKANPSVEVSEIVFVGTKSTEVMYSFYDEYHNEMTMYANSYPYLYNMKDTVLFDGVHAYLFIAHYFDINYTQSWDQDYRNSYLDKKEVKSMGVWPAKDSVSIVDNVIVVKLSNEKEGSI